MIKKHLKNLIITGALALLFVAFTIIVKFVDVGEAGRYGINVGLSSVNDIFASKLPYEQVWFVISEVSGYASIGIALVMAILGVMQWIKRKSLKKVDASLLLLAVLYAVVIIFYLAFIFIDINYRPVPVDGQFEQSYPSSHVMLSICITVSAIVAQKQLCKNNECKQNSIASYCFYAVTLLVLLLTVVGRTLSGVHWITDIVGAILLSATLGSAYCIVLKIIEEKKNEKKGE